MRGAAVVAAHVVTLLLLPSRIFAQCERSCLKGDDAFDPLTTPPERANAARAARNDQAERERDGSRDIGHKANGDRQSDGTLLAIAKFHKTLPHDDLGQVDADAFAALQDCVLEGDFDICEAVPAGGSYGFLANPLGAVPIDMAGPAGSAATTPPPPDLDSAELAAYQAECYWMALTRDVAFSQYGNNNLTQLAAENLAAMPGFSLSEYDVAMNPDGSVDPLKQLFRASFVGVDKGPMISQLLAKNFTLDSIEVNPKTSTFLPGRDYMTDYESWLSVQNGASAAIAEERDPIKRHVRNGRDLSTVVATDAIYTEAFRGTLILMEKGAISRPGFNGPYKNSERQGGFIQYGVSHVMRILAKGERANRNTWYQKWRVHLMQRPEALGGLLHNTLTGALNSTIHESLLANNELLSLVFQSNEAQNEAYGISGGTYLLSQASSRGSPVHPSYPAGHAVQNGAFATMLKAMTGLDRGLECFPDPMEASEDGLNLMSYEPSLDETCLGLDGEVINGLSFEGEINKMAANVAFGRGMLGVHYRFDSTDGMILGETVAVRILHQELMLAPEEYVMEFRLLRGNVIKLFQDGSFSIDGRICDGEVYTGVDECYKCDHLDESRGGDSTSQRATEVIATEASVEFRAIS